MSLRLAILRPALLAQSLLLLVFGIVLVLRTFQPQCIGISAAKAGEGGLVCESFVDRGGLLLVGATIIVTMIALIDVGAARRPDSRLGLSALALQAPLVVVEAMAIVSWYQAGAGAWLFGFIALTVSAIIAIASPNWRTLWSPTKAAE